MIRYIKGIYSMTSQTGIVVETASGIGFEINVPAGSPLYRYGEGEAVLVYTIMVVKEDDISLYGFHNKESLDLFRLLVSVNGIGAKAAMAIMGSMSSAELIQAIMFEDVKAVSRANGVGKKTAERLILELKDKLGGLGAITDASELAPAFSSSEEAAEGGRAQAIEALVALGYSKAEAFAAVARVSEDGLACEEYIKKALKTLF